MKGYAYRVRNSVLLSNHGGSPAKCAATSAWLSQTSSAPLEESAKAPDISLAAAKSRLNRGRKTLR
jgi:hypothetical protein